MPDEKEVQEIKAGVEGILGDVPSPSDSEVAEHDSSGTMNYSETSEQTPVNNYTVNQQQNYAPEPSGGIDMERAHQIIEAVVGEKWEEIMGNVGNIAVWKEKVNNDVLSIKQELVRLEERFEQLQGAVLGRVKEYDEGVRGIHTEMKALEKVFEKILEPLTSNIKDLNEVTLELKKLKR